MKKKDKKHVLSLAVLILLLVCTGCGKNNRDNAENNEKLTVIATLFPQYDFARQIAGEYAEVVLLLSPGMESHSYEPAPADIIMISKADLFVYTGEHMEVWAADLLSGIDTEHLLVVDASEGIALVTQAEVEEAHGNQEGHVHDEEEANRGHVHQYEPHIWTNPVYAKIMVENILEAFVKADPEHESEYREQAAAYLDSLSELDLSIRKIVSEGRSKELFFGGKFALYYFTEEYGLSYESAYDSCSGETEPSARRVAGIIDEIKEKQIPVIFYEELSNPKTAQAIKEETGCEMLLFHSCHNVSPKEFEQGVTYLDLMRQNAENLKEALK